MLRTPDEEDLPLQHRPLPSVDIALLPHELRAVRLQRRAVVGALLLLGLAVAGLAYGKTAWSKLTGPRPQRAQSAAATEPLEPTGGPSEGPGAPRLATLISAPAGGRKSTETTHNNAQAAPISVVGEEGAKSRIEYKFGRARSFREALLACGAAPAEASELIDALQKVVDFRRGKPEDRLIFERDADKQLQVFEYRAGVTEVYRAVRNESGALRGLRVEIPIERRRIAKGTFVAGTLGHSLEALGLGASLAGMVTEAFDSRISFTRDTRAGDSVKIIVDEEYVDGAFLRYGAVHAIEYASARIGKLQAFWFEPDRYGGEFFDNNARALHGGWIRTPLRYDHISSGFNLKRRHPILKRVVPHLGIDYAAGTGTPVWAAADGFVTFAGPRGANGNLVSLRHEGGFETHYAHLRKIGAGIKLGTKLKQRQALGFVGSTGRSTGPHLHFAIKRYGHFVDPSSQLNGPGAPLPSALVPKFRAAVEPLRAELEHIPLAAAPAEEPAKNEDTAEEDEDLDL